MINLPIDNSPPNLINFHSLKFIQNQFGILEHLLGKGAKYEISLSIQKVHSFDYQNVDMHRMNSNI